MKAESKNVALCDVPEGAVVAVDVVDQNGQMLIPAEAELTEKMLSILEHRHIERVDVLVPVQLSEEEKAQCISDISDKLDQQFSGAAANESAMKLKALLFRFHCREL